ncbi:MAG: ribonuclease HII [Candidatus Eisenbacteria sp.]|nr:ribonuclease HII [Candidatus Eisenbacteria bacterium]
MVESETRYGDGEASPGAAELGRESGCEPGAPPDLSGMTVREVGEYVAGAHPEPGDSLWRALQGDPRKGVRCLCDRLVRRRNSELRAREREERMRRSETELWAQGADAVAGIDEAGRGPLAGPVVAAAVILPRDLSIRGIDDSKKLTAAKREELFELIMRDAVSVGTGIISEGVIDEINILRATHLAMREAVAGLDVTPSHVLVDGDPIPDLGFPQTALRQGDSKSTAIAAASIVAKVTRDRMIVELDACYPGYGFARHKGYGTKEHISALMRLGPCEIHRRSFRIVFDVSGGLSELYSGFRAALLAAPDGERLDRIAQEIAREKERLVSFELSKLRGLYKRCYVRLRAGIPAAR